MVAIPLAQLSPRDARVTLEQWRKRPAWWCETYLGAKLTQLSRDLFTALRQPRACIAVRGCHRSGKTFSMGLAAVWWVATGGQFWSPARNQTSIWTPA